MIGHGLTGTADTGAFLARLTRLDPAALVRLRGTAGGRTALWARLPWSVLVSRTVAGTGPADATVSAAALLAALAAGDAALPARRDVDWRVPLPPSSGRVVEALPAAEVRRLAVAAEETLRTAASRGLGGRAVGQRMLRDALLDHVAVVVTGPPGAGPGPTGSRIEVSQRLVQAVVRMGFLGPDPGVAESANGANLGEAVQVRLVGPWIALSAPYGIAWSRTVDNLALNLGPNRTNG